MSKSSVPQYTPKKEKSPEKEESTAIFDEISPISPHIQSWIEFLSFQRRLSQNTLSAYVDDVRDWRAFLNIHLGESPNLAHLEALEVKDFRAWLSHRKDYHPRSTARALASVRSFWRYLEKKELLKNEAANIVRSPRIKKTLPRPLSGIQANYLTENMESSHEEIWMGLRNKALVILLYATGLRISEALSLTKSDAHKEILHIVGKGGKERTIPLLLEARTAMFNYIQKCPYAFVETSPIFFSVRGKPMSRTEANMVIRTFRRVHNLPESLTPHALRHTCATHLMGASGDIRGIQELLGHASLSSTQIYTDLDTEHLFEAYGKTHPRSGR